MFPIRTPSTKMWLLKVPGKVHGGTRGAIQLETSAQALLIPNSTVAKKDHQELLLGKDLTHNAQCWLHPVLLRMKVDKASQESALAGSIEITSFN